MSSLLNLFFQQKMFLDVLDAGLSSLQLARLREPFYALFLKIDYLAVN